MTNVQDGRARGETISLDAKTKDAIPAAPRKPRWAPELKVLASTDLPAFNPDAAVRR